MVPGDESDRASRRAAVDAIKVEAQRLLSDGFELPFKRGVFRYDSSAVLDEVKRRLSEPPFDQVLARAGIDDPRRAGLVVVTTLDPVIQRESTYASSMANAEDNPQAGRSPLPPGKNRGNFSIGSKRPGRVARIRTRHCHQPL